MPFLPLIVCAVLAAPVEDAMNTAADYVAAEDFESARRVLEEAYAADPRLELLYSRAQVERQAGNCEEAHRLFEQFAAAASEEDAADARRLSAQCTPAEPSPPAEPAEPEVEPTPPPVVPALEATTPPPSTAASAPEPVEPRRRWSRRPLPAALMGVGVGALGAGVGLLVFASVNPPNPQDARNEGDYGDLVSANRRLSVAGAAVTAVGAGLAISAGVIWGVLARRAGDARLEGSSRGLSIRF